MKKTKCFLLAVASWVAGLSVAAQEFTGMPVGNPTLPGSHTVSDNKITIVGGGNDIWNRSDNFYYYFTRIDGNFDVRVRVENLEGPHTWSKAELMVRKPETPTADPQGGDPMFAVMTTRTAGQNGVSVQWRAARDARAGWPGWVPYDRVRPDYPNCWLRLVRIGTTLIGYYSNDGTNWLELYRLDTATRSGWEAFDGTVLVGLAVTAHNDADPNGATAEFSDLTFVEEPILEVQGLGFGFDATIADVGPNVVEKVVETKLNGETVAATSSKQGTLTQLTYRFTDFADYLESGSTNQLEVTVQIAGGDQMILREDFVVHPYSVIPEDWALPSATDRGMNVEIYMMSASRGDNRVEFAEQQFARGIIDPATGEPYLNLIDPDTYQVDYVNWVQLRGAGAAYPLDIDDTPEDGPDHFNTALPPENPIPNDWIPGTEIFDESEVNNIVAQVICYLHLTPGYYRMGVNSDDGFRVSVAPGQPDVFGLTLGLFSSPGGRGAADTLFDFLVTKEGYYPFRLLWWEGGSAASCEWFTVNLDTGEYLLINGPQPGAIEAYRTAAGNRAHVSKMLPANGLPGVEAGQQFEWVIEDGTTTVDPNSVKVIWEGEEQEGVAVSKIGKTTTVQWTLPADAVTPNQIIDATGALVFSESNGEVRTNEFSYTIVGWVKPWLTPTEEPEFAIGINFGADEPNGQNLGGLADTDVAGVVPQSHWNNTTGNTGTLANLVASAAGTAVTTSASVEWTCDNTWSSTGRGEENNGFSEGPDRTLMIGYLDTPTDGETRVTIRNIPAELTSSGYDLYIYALGGVSGRGGAYRVEDLDGNILVPTTTVVDRAGNEVQALPFICSSDNPGYFECPGLEDFSVPGNYIVFRGLTAPDIVIVATTQGEWPALDRAPINAIQLVKSSVPQPPSFSSIALSEDGKVVITWEGTATLQQADDVTGPWEDVPDATSPYTVTPTGKKKFFRLKR